MNALFLALLSLFAVASSVRGEIVPWSNDIQWFSNVTMQINVKSAQAAAAFSGAALKAL
jgi:hypothetical protein